MLNLNPKEYYEYYDKIFVNKNYREESEIILKIAKQALGRLPQNIIDIGCGTGSHDLIFAESGCSIYGIDTDCPIIDIAKEKITEQQKDKLKFDCLGINKVENKNFDLAVALFNVINYIGKQDEINSFFHAIAERLIDNGILIFDSWNGLAAIIDNPQEKKSQLEIDGERLEIHSIPTIDLMNQIVKMENQVTINCANGLQKKYNYSYISTLWTPREIKNVLNENGLRVLRISAWMQPEKIADHNNWKITYLCQKKP